MTPLFVRFLLSFPPWVVILSFMAAGGCVGFFLHFPFDHLAVGRKPRRQSDMSGHFLGLVGVLYAVVLAFVVVTAWQERDHTEEVSMQEEAAAVDLFDTVHAFHRTPLAVRRIEEMLLNYARLTEGEWNEMHDGQTLCEYANFLDETQPECRPFKGKLSAGRLTNTLIVRIENNVRSLDPTGERNEALYEQALPALSSLVENRSHRRHHYDEAPLAPVMWLAFFLGAVVIVSLLYLIDDKPRDQRIRAIALCSMIGMMWALAIVFDHPFVGRGGIDGSQWCRIVEHFKLELNPSLAEKSDFCPIDFAHRIRRAT
jgi:Protein of unknown function (DUF4239)